MAALANLSGRGEMMPRKANKRWVRTVKTDSTHPPKGLFKESAPKIAASLDSRRVSPKGPQSGMRMLTYFINRAGKGLSRSRRAELNRAKSLLSKRIKQRRGNSRNGQKAVA